jgi:S-adenosylmethionine:tRNA ribosyltransferase-isomerase
MPSRLRLSDFDYELPTELIAQVPADRRDGSRLLHLPAEGRAAHHAFTELPSLLAPGSLLVVNDTRVIPARLHARKPTGGRVEILLVERDSPTIWRALVRGAKSLTPGMRLALDAHDASALSITYLDRDGGWCLVELRPSADEDVLDVLDRLGQMPLPPYITRDAGTTPADRERYQTVFARDPGAVAAPTAGLHFTDAVLAALRERGVSTVTITLHVGPGTFAPVRDDDLDRHVMHAERYRVPAATAAAVSAARAQGRPVVAVGTTVARTLETAWDDASRTLRPGGGETRLFIRPGHRFRAIDRLVTNFHMPRSTLLMLVCAFAGRDRILDAYRTAVAERYRFFSYGDAMLLDREAA